MLPSVVAKYLKLTWRIFLVHVSTALSFRTSFLLNLIGITLFFGGQFFLWIVFYRQFPSLGGWTSQDLCVVYSLYLFSFSLVDTFAGGIMVLARDINAGNLDYYITLPKPILWHIAVSKAEIESIATLLLSASFFITSGKVTIFTFFLFLGTSIFSAFLIFNFYVITQSIAFFLKGFEQGAGALRHLLSIASTYPFSIFPNGLKLIFLTIIPTFFITMMPAQLILDFSLTNLSIVLSSCIISSIIAKIVFTAGLKHYESGNMISVKL